MTESYLAPQTLEMARQHRDRLVVARCAAADVDRDEPGAVVQLDGGEIGPQQERIAGATVCVADLLLWRLTADAIAELATALRPETWLAFVEPTADTGWRRLLHRGGKPLWKLRLGHHFEKDVPAELRNAGLVLTTMDRFSLGPGGVRSYVRGDARLQVSPPGR